MKVLLCSVPYGTLEESLRPLTTFKFIRPIGITRLVDWMETKGYSGDIYDINNLRPSDEELIRVFKKINPTIVGLSATLTHCYTNVKRITKLLRQLFPDIWIVVGGHITSSANVILKKTDTDICVVGDGEMPWVKFLDYVKTHKKRQQLNYEELSKIKGLAYYDSNDNLKVSYGEQLPASELKNPDYDKLKASLFENGDMIYNYFPKIKDHPISKNPLFQKTKFYQRPNQTVGTIDTSKGCVARCTFCQRYTKGYRTLAAHDLESHILYLKEKYNVTGLEINDENFGSDKKKAYEFARIAKKCDVFWSAGGIRCTSVTYEDLKFYKEHNLVSLKFGIESGSQKILDIMEKKFKKEDVYNAIANCKKTGVITNPDAILVGMPGETRETIIESARFVASLRFVLELDWNVEEPSFWAMAIPGTPLYDYCQQVGLIGKTIDEEEEFLIRTSQLRANFLNYINMTNLSAREIHFWNYLFEYEAKSEYVRLTFKNSKSLIGSLKKVYEKCIKYQHAFLLNALKVYRKAWMRKSSIGFKYKSKIRFYSWSLGYIVSNIFLTLNVLLTPRPIALVFLKAYALLRFRALKAKFRQKKGKQKCNIFIEKNVDLASNLRVSESRIAKTKRQVDRSLRGIALANVKQNTSSLTENEKSLRTLVEGQ